MSLPVWSNKGNFNANNLSVPWPSGHSAGQLGLLFVSTANQAVSAPSGWAELDNSPQYTGAAATAGGVRLHVFRRVAQSASEANAIISGTYNYITAQIHTFAGADSSAPIHLTAGRVDASGTTSMSWASVTTTVPDCLVVLAAAMDTDANNTATCTGYSNSNLSSLTERHDQTVNSGTGGGLVIATGGKETTGAVGATTATGSTSVTHAYLTIALAPSVVVNLAGAACSQGNASATGAISQTHMPIGAACSQGNTSTTGSIGLVHLLACGSCVQVNASGTGAIEVGLPEINLTGADCNQGNACTPGAISQVHNLAGAGCGQSNTSGSDSIGQVHLLAGGSCVQANACSGGAISQDNMLTGAACSQANTAGTDSIGQIHMLVGTDCVQANTSGTGVIAVGMPAINLAGAACSQGNTSTTDSIGQMHLLVGWACVQVNASVTGAIEIGMPAINLSGADCSWGNGCTAGAITVADFVGWREELILSCPATPELILSCPATPELILSCPAT